MAGLYDQTPCDDPIVGFSILPQGALWRWRTLDARGQVRAEGVTRSRRTAAALVIRDILKARIEAARSSTDLPRARAA